METNPTPQRQRTRRADRSAAEGAAQQIWQQPAIPPAQPTPGISRTAQPTAAPQPIRSAQSQQPVQPQPRPYATPVQRAASPYPNPQLRQAQPAPQRTGGNTAPRALQRTNAQVNSGWSMPQQTADAGRADMSPAPRQPTKEKLPGWVWSALALSLIAVMGLVAGYFLIQAQITTRENERRAAYEKVLFNYHITEPSPGLHRITWQDEIEKYAAEYNLQPAFVAAIIDTESDYRTEATSSVNAKGLMQLMPDTAEWIAGKLDDDGYTEDSMYEPVRNIRYGCWYLNFLSQKFRGDPILIACAYHAGQGNVESWLSNRKYSSDGLTIALDSIPMEDSRTYARRVTTAYGIYQTLLYTNDPQLPVYDAGSHDAVSGDAR